MNQSDIGLWVFGYGSIIWRPEIPYIVDHFAVADGWARRFWQGSHDHRGTRESPGRVLTLVRFKGEQCMGRVFGVPRAEVAHTLAVLDYREKNGYERQQLVVRTDDETEITALTYIAAEGNPAWLGEDTDDAIAKQILSAQGPSGSNIDYVLSLHAALKKDGINDSHLENIANLVR